MTLFLGRRGYVAAKVGARTAAAMIGLGACTQEIRSRTRGMQLVAACADADGTGGPEQARAAVPVRAQQDGRRIFGTARLRCERTREFVMHACFSSRWRAPLYAHACMAWTTKTRYSSKYRF
jgi:hypothetical protein